MLREVHPSSVVDENKNDNVPRFPATKASDASELRTSPESKRLGTFEKLPLNRVVSFGYEGHGERLRKTVRSRSGLFDY